ncbi:hypothetical protein BDQ12DRAFT_275293 [Crucibulum laeve]|uniref:Uncharacterized protein n=1 Tax=Crucibulum laeve TaxID=68775 RepID=A0A5C3MAE0_9AGAR|nr:hypothetical protein BDQ12DRAFT_275293 [Crucibulum laeve]
MSSTTFDSLLSYTAVSPPGTAIQKAADLLIELFEKECQVITESYHAEQHNLEQLLKRYQDDFHAAQSLELSNLAEARQRLFDLNVQFSQFRQTIVNGVDISHMWELESSLTHVRDECDSLRSKLATAHREAESRKCTEELRKKDLDILKLNLVQFGIVCQDENLLAFGPVWQSILKELGIHGLGLRTPEQLRVTLDNLASKLRRDHMFYVDIENRLRISEEGHQQDLLKYKAEIASLKSHLSSLTGNPNDSVQRPSSLRHSLSHQTASSTQLQTSFQPYTFPSVQQRSPSHT